MPIPISANLISTTHLLASQIDRNYTSPSRQRKKSKWRMKNKFLVLGRAGMDLYADPPGTRVEEAKQFTSALGGSAANIAVGLVKLGASADLISAVSDDAVGRYALRELANYHVGTQHVKTIGGGARNSLAVVETRHENCQSVIYRNDAADFHMDEVLVKTIPYTEYNYLIVTGTALAAEPSRSATLLAMALAQKAGLRLIIDLDYRPYSWASVEEARLNYQQAANMCGVIVGNDEEFAVLGHSLESVKTISSKLIVYKMGEKGSVTVANGTVSQVGVFNVKALKPTGAGDAFMAGFATSIASGVKIDEAVRRGSAAAAIVVTRVGCAPAMPTELELNEFLVTHAHSTL
jgi:5-dehydro-2-deoxygluconokinase